MVGGHPTKTSIKSVEAITEDGIPLCTLPDLPDKRIRHTMDNHIMCGGFFTQSSCLYCRGGEWTQYKNDLKIKRSDHVSWRSPDGKVLLIGGDGDPTKKSQKTSEVVSSSDHQNGFILHHEVR